MKSHPTLRTLPLVLFAIAAPLHLALAYYDPGAQRWLNRDPVSDKGFRLLAAAKTPAQQPNSFCFVRNRPSNELDALGLEPVPPGPSDGSGAQYLERLGQCIAIGFNRQKEYEDLDRRGKLSPDADKWYHCVVSCEMTRTCGSAAARLLGDFREIWQDISQPEHDPSGTDTALDKQANRNGRSCGNCKEKRSCEECCEALGYRRS